MKERLINNQVVFLVLSEAMNKAKREKRDPREAVKAELQTLIAERVLSFGGADIDDVTDTALIELGGDK